MNNARRILSKGSTLLRGYWFWSKKLLFQKNFDENFNAVERVRVRSMRMGFVIPRSTAGKNLGTYRGLPEKYQGFGARDSRLLQWKHDRKFGNSRENL